MLATAPMGTYFPLPWGQSSLRHRLHASLPWFVFSAPQNLVVVMSIVEDSLLVVSLPLGVVQGTLGDVSILLVHTSVGEYPRTSVTYSVVHGGHRRGGSVTDRRIMFVLVNDGVWPIELNHIIMRRVLPVKSNIQVLWVRYPSWWTNRDWWRRRKWRRVAYTLPLFKI